MTITRDGKPVAKLEPLARARLSATAVIERFGRLPALEPQRLRDDVDTLVDQRL